MSNTPQLKKDDMNDTLSYINGKRHWFKNTNKIKKAVSLLISCDKRNSDLSVVSDLQDWPYCGHKGTPFKKKLQSIFINEFFGGKENIFTYMLTNICISFFHLAKEKNIIYHKNETQSLYKWSYPPFTLS